MAYNLQPITRSSRRQRLIIREGSWNTRFHLSTIPAYDPFRDIHCTLHPGQNYRLSVAKNKVVYLRAGTLSRHASKHRQLREGLPGSSPGFDIPQATLEELVKLWGTKGLPVEQQSAFLAVIEGLPEDFKAEVISEEVALVHRDKSLAQQVDRLVLNREDCLVSLQALIQAFERQGAAPKATLDQFTETLTKLRDLTMQTLLAVQAWRQHLYSLNPSNHRILKLPYIWEGENYVLKIRHDSSFLKDSSLDKLYEFSKRSDPFLLYPSYAFKQHKTLTKKLDLPLAPGLQDSLKACEAVLLEEILNCKEIDRTFRRETDRKGAEFSQIAETKAAA